MRPKAKAKVKAGMKKPVLKPGMYCYYSSSYVGRLGRLLVRLADDDAPRPRAHWKFEIVRRDIDSPSAWVGVKPGQRYTTYEQSTLVPVPLDELTLLLLSR